MRIPRIFLDRALACGDEHELDAAGARHVGTVLRLRPGAPLVVFDGAGSAFEADVLAAGRRGCRVRLGRCLEQEREAPLAVTLALGVSRGERMDLAIQKAVELGVARIVPLLTEHGVVRLDAERAARRLAHWRGVAIGACEQCGRNRLPALEPVDSLVHWLGERTTLVEGEYRLLPDPRAGLRLRELEPPGDGGLTVLVGPEGGFSDAERALADRHGFTGVRLGPRVLRTETAVIAVLAAVMTLWGDLG